MQNSIKGWDKKTVPNLNFTKEVQIEENIWFGCVAFLAKNDRERPDRMIRIVDSWIDRLIDRLGLLKYRKKDPTLTLLS